MYQVVSEHPVDKRYARIDSVLHVTKVLDEIIKAHEALVLKT